MRQTIIFERKEYRKHKNGYYCRTEQYLLHRVIWEAMHGPIPEGHSIHHKDGNKENNEPANLECITQSDHAKRHWEEDYDNWKAKVCENIKQAHIWRGTKEGRASASKHHKRLWENPKEYTRKCEECGQEFSTLSRKPNRWCSTLCHSRGYYKESKEIRNCVDCGNEFEIYKYHKTRTCSMSCRISVANKSRASTNAFKRETRYVANQQPSSTGDG